MEYDNNTNLPGYWSYAELQNDSIRVFTKVSKLPDDNYGFGLEANGVFKERKNAGFCGTPPITYASYEGSWNIHQDTMLHIEVPYWGGESIYYWGILSVSHDQLKVYSINEEYLMD